MLVWGVEYGHGCCWWQAVVVGVWSPPVVQGLDIAHGGLSGVLADVEAVMVVELVLLVSEDRDVPPPQLSPSHGGAGRGHGNTLSTVAYMSYDQMSNDVQSWLVDSIDEVVRTQPELWDWNLGERTRVTEIFSSLRTKVPRSWNVDMEWNREGNLGDVKRRPIRYGTPDIVIHRRGESGPENNLLVAEFKNLHSKRGQDEDQEKIEDWMDRFGYRFGTVLSLNRNSQGVFVPKGLWSCWENCKIHTAPWSPTSNLRFP